LHDLKQILIDVYKETFFIFSPLSAKKSKVKVTLCQRAHRLPASPPLIYNFSISPTCGFGFGDPHPALKGLYMMYNDTNT